MSASKDFIYIGLEVLQIESHLRPPVNRFAVYLRGNDAKDQMEELLWEIYLDPYCRIQYYCMERVDRKGVFEFVPHTLKRKYSENYFTMRYHLRHEALKSPAYLRRKSEE